MHRLRNTILAPTRVRGAPDIYYVRLIHSNRGDSMISSKSARLRSNSFCAVITENEAHALMFLKYTLLRFIVHDTRDVKCKYRAGFRGVHGGGLTGMRRRRLGNQGKKQGKPHG